MEYAEQDALALLFYSLLLSQICLIRLGMIRSDAVLCTFNGLKVNVDESTHQHVELLVFGEASELCPGCGHATHSLCLSVSSH